MSPKKWGEGNVTPIPHQILSYIVTHMEKIEVHKIHVGASVEYAAAKTTCISSPVYMTHEQ